MNYYKVCDCCGKRATHNVKRFDSFYEFLCDDCYEQWQSDKDDTWDETNY